MQRHITPSPLLLSHGRDPIGRHTRPKGEWAVVHASLGLSMNFEAVTARYVDVRLERVKEVLDSCHNAIRQTAPAAKDAAAPEQGRGGSKKKSAEMEL